MVEKIESKMQRVDENQYIAVTDTETLHHWQHDRLLDPKTANLKESQRVYHPALQLIDNHRISKSEVAFGVLGAANEAAQLSIRAKDAAKNIMRAATGQPVEVKPMTALDEAQAKLKPIRTAVVIANKDEKGHFHQKSAFIGDVQADGMLRIDTMQNDMGLVRFNAAPVVVHSSQIYTREGVAALQKWEKEISTPGVFQAEYLSPTSTPATMRLPPVTNQR